MHTLAHGSVDDRGHRIAGSRAQRSWRESAAAALLLAAASGMAALADDLPGACEEEKTPNGKPLDITVGGEFNTDYVYRGITLSARQPAVGASIEVDRGPFYFTFEPHSVKLPTNPLAELGFAAGFCKAVVKDITIDLGATYLYYPGEIAVGPVTSTSYWEVHATVSIKPVDMLTLAAMYAYSPNYSNTGAWEHYVEGNFEIELTKVVPLPNGIEWSFSGNVGRSWFGIQSSSLGGFPLPGYTYWSLGISFIYEPFTLNLSYTNTNLTKENCFVFTGDPNAVPGGAIDLITNPQGLRSNWCGPAFVATLSAEFSPGK